MSAELLNKLMENVSTVTIKLGSKTTHLADTASKEPGKVLAR